MQYQEYLRTYHYRETRKTPDNDVVNYDFWPVVLMGDGTYRKGPEGGIHNMVNTK